MTQSKQYNTYLAPDRSGLRPAAGRRAPRPAFRPGRPRIPRPHGDPGVPPARRRGRRTDREGPLPAAAPGGRTVRGRGAVRQPRGLPTRGELPGCRRRARRAHGRRRVPLPADTRRDGLAPVQRGPPRAAVGDPRRSSTNVQYPRRGRARGVFRGVGAQRQGRQPDRELQRLGRQRSATARAGVHRSVGTVLARLRRGRTVQVSRARRRRRRHRPGRPVRVRHRSAAPDRLEGDDERLPVARRGLDDPARREEPGVRTDEHLRGAPGVMAARPELPPACQRTHRIRSVTRVHPRRDASGRRAPVRRIVGISGHVVLRADVAAGHSRRLQGTGRRAAPGGDRRDRGLGARPLPQGRLGAGPLRRNSALRALRPSPR